MQFNAVTIITIINYSHGVELNIVPFMKKYMNIQNNIENNNVPPAKASANNIPRINNGIPIYCITNGRNVKQNQTANLPIPLIAYAAILKGTARKAPIFNIRLVFRISV